MKFGEHLLSTGKITSEALLEGLDIQRFRPLKLGRLLRDLGHLSQAELNRQLHVFKLAAGSMKELSAKTLGSELKAKVTAGLLTSEIMIWANSNGWVLFNESNESDGAVEFLGESYQDELLEQAEDRFKKAATLVVVSADALNHVRHLAGLIMPGSPDSGGSRDSGASHLRVESKATDEQKIGASDPYTSLFRDTILAARTLGASDIHIQPSRDGLDIRFRVNGDMSTWKTLSLEHRRSFINEVKRLTNLSIAISGRAQDGRTSFKSWQLDLRASLLPSQYGEKIVLRLLDLTRNFDLSSLGFDPETHNDLLQALQSKNGVIIISGPTGSGKTTTLYTLLCALDRSTRNIITLEDPIEYGIEGLTQVQVSPKLTFAEALRSVLRQDPDVILVGEIRDAETADLCIKAASTGHLVLSTLHANGAAEVVGRLINLGIDPYMLKSVLRFTSAQRLVKRLCPSCSIPGTCDAGKFFEKASDLKLRAGAGIDYRKREPNGCPQCQSGIKGRVPVLEYMRAQHIKSYLEAPPTERPQLTVSLQEACLR
ncbi:GspE/PulE family protein, partial [Bdellovibrionota bacterium FG-2]